MFPHTRIVVTESIINPKPALAPDFKSPLPTRQFRAFLSFFHAVFLLGIGLSLYSHVHEAKREPGTDAALITLIAAQILLYLVCFVIPSFTGRWLPSRWWWAYWVVSVGLVLGASRIDPVFHWALVLYLGQVSALSLRISVPVNLALLAVYFLNRFGWDKLATWTLADWFYRAFELAPFMALILFMGRMVATSAARGRLILELEAAKRELELARQREAELAALHERERLARDLHDSLGHSLATLTVQLEAAVRLQASDPGRATDLLLEMQKLTRSSMEALRRSLANLRAPGLGERPLTEALQALCAQAGKHNGAAVECRLDAGIDSLPPTVAEALWRVAQEGLTNAEKHAQAKHVQVKLSLEPKEIVLRVADDGIGLPPNAEEKPGHYGLRGLRERVEGLGGTFTLGAAESKGTAVEARVPVIA